MALRVINIAEGTTVDGPGLRTSIYLAGCTHHCPGCHNPASWSPEAGTDWSIEKLMSVIRYNQFPVTLSGGDPLLQAEELLPLLQRIQQLFSEHPGWKRQGGAVWCYTGYTWEEIRDKSPYKELLPYIDVLVEGPFLEAEKAAPGEHLRFRGSKNQRFICPDTGEELTF